MFDLRFICSQYELLELLAQNLHVVDLYPTALTCSDLYDLITQPAKRFDRLKRATLCGGIGLHLRQHWIQGKAVKYRLWNAKCESASTRPCLKCGISVCENCRAYPRTGTHQYGPFRRPHMNYDMASLNLICYCDDCDKAVEERTGADLCTCDRYVRWICRPCETKEDDEVHWYYKFWTRQYGEDGEEEGMVLACHQHCMKVRCSNTKCRHTNI